jgi:putative tryptophan/tyrosine transport system substrate-binding protein
MKRREFIAALGGMAAAWPSATGAQQGSMPIVGFLDSGPQRSGRSITVAAFLQGLGEFGYAEAQNVEILYRWAESRNDRLSALAADLVGRGVAVIFASGGPAPVLAAKSLTATIPIVFANGADPVDQGLVASLSRPGGNVTGITFLTRELNSKRLELLHEIAPAANLIGYLIDPTTTATNKFPAQDAEEAARVLGVRLAIANASTRVEINRAFATLVEQRIGALLVGGDPLFDYNRAQIAALATRHAVPAIYATRDSVEAGGLMSYGASISDAVRLAGNYAGRILKGEKPADLPVQQSTRIEMVLNLKVAKALRLEMPPSILVRADEVIE